MPTYCYRNLETGVLAEVFMTVSQMLDREREDGTIQMDGAVLKRDYEAELGGARSAGTWPVLSDSAGCHPSQIPEMKDHARRVAGVNLDFNREGQAIFESPGQRKKYLRSIGVRDNNGGYGDP